MNLKDTNTLVSPPSSSPTLSEEKSTETLKTLSLAIEDPCLTCGAESDYGIHGIKDNEAHSRYYCAKCYHADRRVKHK